MEGITVGEKRAKNAEKEKKTETGSISSLKYSQTFQIYKILTFVESINTHDTASMVFIGVVV